MTSVATPIIAVFEHARNVGRALCFVLCAVCCGLWAWALCVVRWALCAALCAVHCGSHGQRICRNKAHSHVVLMRKGQVRARRRDGQSLSENG